MEPKKNIRLNLFILTIALIIFQSCCDPETDCKSDTANIVETFTDIDSNLYHGIKIGNQIWMLENLRTTRYRNGDPITQLTDQLQWLYQKNGACCNYDNNPANSNVYGKLYNWYAVNDNRQLAPDGWHVPVDSEFYILINFLGGNELASDKLKECGKDHWYGSNTSATNESGFTALPGGVRFDGRFLELGRIANWWTSSDIDTTWARQFSLSYYSNIIGTGGTISTKDQGLSIRCIKD
jgi:uncharacterized protein (TIGR02145 family)